jgi:2-succinyl-6-hydroxy-2,4-cyclohexadiene-1-carboxylate synthase
VTACAVGLLHGFTGSPRSFAVVAAALAREGVAVHAPALLGHGPHEESGADSFEGEVERLAAYFRSRGDAHHLVGYSLGGRIALGLLLRDPRLFRSATLVSAQPGLADEAQRSERRLADERWCALLESHGLEQFVDAWERQPLFAAQIALPPDALARQRAERLDHRPRGLARSLRICGLAAMPSYWARLVEIDVPTTLVVGESDAKFAAIAEEMHAAMPRARVVVTPGAGHNVVLERPEAVARLVLASVREAA